MRVLIAHNAYRQAGGEDTVAAAEAALLRANGHEVIEYHRSNVEIESLSAIAKLALPIRMAWSRKSYEDVRSLIRRVRPDVAHFHNTFLMISPSAYAACRAESVPVVQSLHNPRLMCPAGTLYREGRACEECIGKFVAWPGVLHACWQGSATKTAAIAGMLAFHRLRRTWLKEVDAYIVFSEFYRAKFEYFGLPREKIYLKPHFVWPEPPPSVAQTGRYALFVGRLDAYKGIETMLRAWESMPDIPLRIRGDGDLAPMVRQWIADHPGHDVALVERLERDALFALMREARFLVWPSEGHYETFGLVAIEAFACGTPVIASRIGVLEEMIEDGRVGLHFTVGDAANLASVVQRAYADLEMTEAMGKAARQVFESRYDSKRNYVSLMHIYEKAICRG